MNEKIHTISASNSDLQSKLRTSEESIAVSKAELLRANQEVAGLKIKLDDEVREQLERGSLIITTLLTTDERNQQLLKDRDSEYRRERQELEDEIKSLEEEIPKLQKVLNESQAKIVELVH